MIEEQIREIAISPDNKFRLSSDIRKTLTQLKQESCNVVSDSRFQITFVIASA